MSNNLLFYSTNTKIAFFISEQFYNSIHFVWCSPVYDPQKLNKYDYRSKIPVSSSPYRIYKQLLDDVKTGDKHSTKIEQNKTGLKKGAAIMRQKEIIDDIDFARILSIIDSAELNEFVPILYLIPESLVFEKIKSVEIESIANPLSSEFQIQELLRNEFEIIELD